MSDHRKVGVVILAAGHGTRMKSEIPKVMTLLDGTPLVEHVVKCVEDSGCCNKPVVVVSADHTLVQDLLGGRAEYAIQEEQLGTGHATAVAEEALKDKVDNVVVLYGDMPFMKASSLSALVERHLERNNTMTLMTATVEDFEGNRVPFKNFSRIVRGGELKHIVKIVEVKDASEEELKIREINPVFFCIKADWLWNNLSGLESNNAQGELYLTDLVKMAIDEGEQLSSIDIDPLETLGVNTQEDLQVAKNQLEGSV